jgi:hypothetical protein
MKSLASLLSGLAALVDGNKTYITAAVTGLYALWCQQHGKVPDENVKLFILAAIAWFFRHAIAKLAPTGTAPTPVYNGIPSKASAATLVSAVAACLLVFVGLGLTGTGCALSAERSAYTAVGAELDAADAAAKAYAANFVQREAKNEADKLAEGYAQRHDDLVKEQGKFNELVSRYAVAHRSALRLYLAAKAAAAPGTNLPTDLHAWSDELASAEADLLAFTRSFIGKK